MIKNKCLISLHPGHFVSGSTEMDNKQNFLIHKNCKIKIFNLNYPKNNYEETMKYLNFKLKELSHKYDIFLIGRSSGGFLAKVLYDLNPKLIKKVIYLSPVFNPLKRQKINTRFKKYQDFYFRFTSNIPETKLFNLNKEFIFLASNDNNIPRECFTAEQKKHIQYFNKTHAGLIFSTNSKLIDLICNIIND